jgi:hypothetical protein
MGEARVTIDQLNLEDRVAQLLMPRPASAEEWGDPGAGASPGA